MAQAPRSTSTDRQLLRLKHAFTLVELLVVIGIIAVLISLLLPALNKAREQSRRIVCASNMRQLGFATLQYANNNRGHLPAPAWGGSYNPIPGPWQENLQDYVYWTGPLLAKIDKRDVNDSALAPYLGAKDYRLISLYRCPDDVIEENAIIGQFLLSYTMNCTGWVPDSQQWGRAKTVAGKYRPLDNMYQWPHSSHKIIYYDESDHSEGDGAFWWANPGDLFTGRHNHMGNATFLDWHVEIVDAKIAHAQGWNDPIYTGEDNGFLVKQNKLNGE